MPAAHKMFKIWILFILGQSFSPTNKYVLSQQTPPQLITSTNGFIVTKTPSSAANSSGATSNVQTIITAGTNTPLTAGTNMITTQMTPSTTTTAITLNLNNTAKGSNQLQLPGAISSEAPQQQMMTTSMPITPNATTNPSTTQTFLMSTSSISPSPSFYTTAPTGQARKNGTDMKQLRMGFLMANGLSTATIAAGSNIFLTSTFFHQSILN